MKKGVGALEGIRETGSFCSVDHHKQLLGKEQVAKGARADGTEKQREKVDLKGNDSGVLFLKVPEGSLAAITRFYASSLVPAEGLLKCASFCSRQKEFLFQPLELARESLISAGSPR